MLRAIRPVLRPGGRVAFLTMQPTPGLSASDRRRAHQVGAPAIAVRTSYQSMMSTAGFVDIGSKDQTAEYRATLLGWIRALDLRADAVREIVGPEMYAEQMQRRHRALAAIDAGLLSRFMYWATRSSVRTKVAAFVLTDHHHDADED